MTDEKRVETHEYIEKVVPEEQPTRLRAVVVDFNELEEDDIITPEQADEDQAVTEGVAVVEDKNEEEPAPAPVARG